MISRFTHLIYGRSSVDEEEGSQSTAAAAAAAGDPSNAESMLLTTSAEENDEWLIVERSDCEAHDIADNDDFPESFDEVSEPSQHRLAQSLTSTPVKSESSNTSGSEETSDFERFRGPYVSMQDYDPQSDTALSDVSSQPEQVTHPSLEECWIVTPPPCFTASESSADTVVGMHPLENLLIEHPSMSVYWPRGDRRDPEDDDEDEGQGHGQEGQGHGQEVQGQGRGQEIQGHGQEVQGHVPETQGQGHAQEAQGQAPQAQVRGRVVENVARRGGRGVSDNGIVSPHNRYQLPVGVDQTFDYRSPYNFRRDQYIRMGGTGRSPSTTTSPTESSPSNTAPPTTSGSTSHQQRETGTGTIVLNMQQQQTMDRSANSFLTPHNIRLTANRVAGSYLGLFVRGSRAADEVQKSQKSQRLSVRSGNSQKVLDQQNRVREFAATGKIRQRKDRMGECPSGRSNNRKC